MKILVRDRSGVRALEEGYASEGELQMFLREYSELMPIDEIRLGTPPLFCIGCEVDVTSGAADLLYIDETGLLTVVETKLKKNPQVRREVVGQILEYAAQASAWSPKDIQEKAERFFSSKDCPSDYKGLTLEEALRRFLERTNPQSPEIFSYEDFLNQVSANLERGRIRLVIAVDEPPEPLLRTVEFINRFSERFEMYLIQLKQFRDKTADQSIFVPALFGRVAGAKTPRPPGRIWDRESFLQQASEKCPERVPVLTRLIELAESENALAWGRGASIGTFTFVFGPWDGRKLPAFFVGADGKMSVDFWTLGKWLDPKIIASYRADLALAKAIPREAIGTDTWKNFDVSVLSAQESWEAFKHAVLSLRKATSEATP